MAIKYIRTPTLPKTPIGGTEDVFSIENDGLAPKAPKKKVSGDGKDPDFGYFQSSEENWDLSYEDNIVTLKHTSGGAEDKGWVGVTTDLTHVRFDKKKSRYFNEYIVVGAKAGFLYGYNPDRGEFASIHSSWITYSGYTVVPANTPFEISVTKTSFTVTVNGVSTVHDISSYGITYATLGYASTKAQSNNSISFENLESGTAEYAADNTKFLRSDGTWQGQSMTPSAFPSEFKNALLACFRNVAWIGNDGSDYYNALSALLNDSGGGGSSAGWQSGVPYANVATVSGQKIDSTNGSFSDVEGWSRTDFVPCEGASRIVFPKLYETAMQADNAAFYSKSRQRVSGIILSLSDEKEIAVPSGAAFFAVSSETSALARLLSDGITPYA